MAGCAARWRPTCASCSCRWLSPWSTTWEPRSALVEVKGIIADDTRITASRIIFLAKGAFPTERAHRVILRIQSTGGNLGCSVGMGVTGVDAHRIPDTLVTRELRFMGPTRRTSEIRYGRSPPQRETSSDVSGVDPRPGRDTRESSDPSASRRYSPKGLTGQAIQTIWPMSPGNWSRQSSWRSSPTEPDPSDGSCLRPAGVHRAIFRA